MRRMIQTMKTFKQEAAGVALLEFAFTLPVLLAVFFAGVELTRYVIILQKVDKTAYTIADLVTRSAPATSYPASSGELDRDEMDDIFATFDDLMQPFGDATSGIVVVTSIERPVGVATPIVRWQVAGGGTLTGQISNVNRLSTALITPAVRNTPVNFDGDIDTAFTVAGPMEEGENIIIVETFYQFDPLFGLTLQFFDTPESAIFKRNALFNPRYGNLDRLPPDF